MVTSLGSFDATRGGHLFLRELGLVVEFPIGASVLLPSAVIAHGNTRLGKSDDRASVTMYNAGGNIRWRDQGFRPQRTMTKREKREFDAAASLRLEEAVNRFSKIGELAADHKALTLSMLPS